MPLPRRIPIAHESDYRTDTIGRYAHGQFYAAVHGAQPELNGTDTDYDGRNRWYAYLHLFDHDGRHQRSDIRLLQVSHYFTADDDADRVLAELLAQLPEAEFGDIAIQPFRLVHDGIVFGLIDESEPERGDWAELYPDRLGFHSPWNGEYST